MEAREPRTMFIGATPNGNKKVGGWLPFVVDLSPIYKTMHVYGTLYTNYESCTYRRKGDAYYAARQYARNWFAEEGDTIQEVNGCHRCWDDENPRHLEWAENGKAMCANCGRRLPRLEKTVEP